MKTNSILQLLEQHKIVIPPIQRDYAQGRSSNKVVRIRERFLDAIVEVLSNDKLPPLELDFVYGYTEKDKDNSGKEFSVFKPLDGQQRLTTLFLIHWYVSQNEGKEAEARLLLSNFSYATRQSSRSFCEKLILYKPEKCAKPVNELITNEPWFFSAWQSDPTVASMLVVLKNIEAKFRGLENVWEKLKGDHPRIIFHLLPMEDLGLPDDLYIKMNARGKELTDFEYFKSQFSEVLDTENAKVFNDKIDKEWSDLFWNIFKEKSSDDIAKEVDSGFLSFFWYITDLLIAQKSIQLDDTYWLNIVKTVYNENADNVKFLFDTLNMFEQLERESPDYFDSTFYIESSDFEITKTRLFFISPQPNLFRKCVETYGYEGKSNNFSVGEQLILYALIYMKLGDKMDASKYRTLRNIFSSSEDQLRRDYLSSFLYKDVESIIDSNQYSTNSKLSKRQFDEENMKSNFILNCPHLKEIIYKLEDHHLLRGNISIFTLDNTLPGFANEFHRIFVQSVNYFEISRAMLTIGDYSQEYGNIKRFGNKNNSTWRELFTQSEFRKGFEKTSEILKSYLEIFINNGQETNQTVIRDYLIQFEEDKIQPKDWIYYYIKYNSFILWDENQTNGFYKWDSYKQKPYECTMLFRTQFNGRHWSPFLLELSKLSKNLQLDNFGNDLQFTNSDIILLIKNGNSGFKFYANDELSKNYISQLILEDKLNEDSVLVVFKNEEGLDLEDRIMKCSEFLSALQNEL